MNKTYKLILLDADDTLFDYGKAETTALSLTLNTFKIDYSTELHQLYKQINSGLWAALEQGTVDKAFLKIERFRALFEALGLSVDAEAFSNLYLQRLGEGIYLLPGAEAICQYLSDKYQLAIITNGIQEVQWSRIRNSKIQKYISDIIVSEEAEFSKPDPRIFQYAADRLGFYDKEQMLIIGDSLSSDILGGVQYGIDTCWFNPHQIEPVQGLNPTYTIDRLEAIMDIL